MIKFVDCRIFFPVRLSGEDGRFSPEFIGEYIARYTDPETGWATVHWDDEAHTRRRNASFPAGDIAPDLHDADGTIQGDVHGPIVGCSFFCGWHPQFLADIEDPPEGDEELFEGVQILTGGPL